MYFGTRVSLTCGLFLEKNRVLAEAQAEIKSLRLSDRLKQKAVDEVHTQLHVSLRILVTD